MPKNPTLDSSAASRAGYRLFSADKRPDMDCTLTTGKAADRTRFTSAMMDGRIAHDAH